MGLIRTDRYADNCISTQLQFHSKTPLVPSVKCAHTHTHTHTLREFSEQKVHRKGDIPEFNAELSPRHLYKDKLAQCH